MSTFVVQMKGAGVEGAPRFWGALFSAFEFRFLLLLAGVIALSLASSHAYAHKVNMFAYVEGNKVMMEGYFADGNKPMNCDVIVTDPDKNVLVKGLTDHNGKFSFDIPKITDLRIVLNAGMGHRAEFLISRDELSGVSPTVVSEADSKTSEGHNEAPVIGEAATEEAAPSPPGSVSASEAVVRKAVAEANLPLMRAIEELKERAGFANIVGGIGFIFGIVGILFYVKARKMLDGTGSRSSSSTAAK